MHMYSGELQKALQSEEFIDFANKYQSIAGKFSMFFCCN